MTMITPQRLAHERLPAGHVLALELLQGTGAVVQLSHAGRVVESVQISASRSFGPYMHDMTAAVSCFAGSLVGATVSADTAPGLSASQRAGSASLVSGDRTPVTSSRDITADDNGKFLTPSGTLTLTIPAGLDPMPSFTVDCPASGTVSIARSGAATINGAGTTLTRTRANNPVGFVVLAHESDAYGVSGA